ncbi:sensor histidine kinase [Kocuria sp. LHG3120]|uniref:sensor histidine kinase n=1 Tax=Kocuria sp. LHG3120 TaxID=2804590 RepID=UPI003CFA3125
MIAKNGMTRGWGLWLLVAAALVGVAPVPYTAAVDGWWVAPNVVFQLVVYATGFTLLRVPEHRRNATHLVLAGVASATGYLLSEPIASIGYWFQLGYVTQWLVAPLFLRVLLSYPAPGPRGRSASALLRATWLWATVPWLVSAAQWNPAHAEVPNSTLWVRLVDFESGANIVALIGSAGSIVVGIWTIRVMWQRWRSAKGPLAPRSRLVAAAGILLAVGVGSREIARVLVDTNRINWEGRAWIETGHTVLAIVVVLLTVGSVYWSFAQRPRVVEAMVATAGDAPRVEAALRSVLGDPTARLYYDIAGIWLDAHGAQASPAPTPGRLRKILPNDQGQPSALADLDDVVLEDPIQTRIALSATQLVLEAAHLAVERDAYAKELAESRKRIVTDSVTQRIELERALHDGVQQHLLAVSTTLSRAQLASNPIESADVIDQAQNQLTEALAELRRLARGIHPVALGHGGLPGGLRVMVDRWDDCELVLRSPEPSFACLDETVRATCYFAAAEALANAIKYGSRPVTITAACDGQEVTITVVDRGAGGARPVPGGGLAGLRDRLAAVGGRTMITSPEGGPTMIEIRSPVHTSTALGAP